MQDWGIIWVGNRMQSLDNSTLLSFIPLRYIEYLIHYLTIKYKNTCLVPTDTISYPMCTWIFSIISFDNESNEVEIKYKKEINKIQSNTCWRYPIYLVLVLLY